MTHELYANNFEELYKIHDHQFNIAFMNVNQLVPEGLENYLASNFDKIPGMYKEIISKNNFEESISQLDEIYYVLDECEDKINLIQFIKTIVSNFADVTDSPDMGVSIEKVEGDLCKYFHCDMNHLRLVFPLLGPGTFWASEDNLRREFLGLGQNEKVIIKSDQIKQVPNGVISILKGQGHPSALGKAVVHASPPISQSCEKRILLRVESLF